jgi:ATP-dependent Clp protease ATP-binding subunit ClpA
LTGAQLLLALFSERESPAAQFLAEQGVTRLDAANFVAHGSTSGGGGAA